MQKKFHTLPKSNHEPCTKEVLYIDIMIQLLKGFLQNLHMSKINWRMNQLTHKKQQFISSMEVDWEKSYFKALQLPVQLGGETS